ncbi:MAG: metallophosphoesterase, partial [Deltaproteobacteria bacterium]|nr:metallophosphoesterase [Deltaproteobacteria bacterium]
LVISDLHLRGGHSDTTAGLYHFDEEFADFLRYYRLHRSAERPWQLIIAGDFIEFLYITDLPSADDPLLRGAQFVPSEHIYGARTEAAKSRWKIDRILRTGHPQLLLALARFIAEGNSIVVLRGNHDAEMVWPEVQAHFRRLLAEHHPADVGYMAMKEAVAQRLIFAPWFWYVPEKLYVEHGCQYDPCCAFEYFLHPVMPSDPARIENSISDLSVRYFANQMKLLNAMATENIKSISEYIVWVVRNDLGLIPRAFHFYRGMVRGVLGKSGRPDPEKEMPVREEHRRRLAAADEQLGLAPGTTARVDALHARPVMRSWFAALRFLGLDLLSAAAALLAAVTVILVVYPHQARWIAVLAVAAALGLVVYAGALRFTRIVEYGQLRGVAERLGDLFGVRNVIFGHSHKAGVSRLARQRSYFNVGTWVPLKKHAYFVYFALEGDELDGRLWRWNKEKQEPESFEGRQL